ncbi:MAG TPA: addiction module antidote protein, HigA family [Cyanobacteria bacterium UBA11991]|nr:HigA family addiction module antitoxin [Cyanobacteriota bacterium]MDY6358117.1 HigA family addiction module antitoxin [Cyanobacteriota bacterium]MDY6365011.1 HigA family addiction module antitoxin [Cyanobacteriota bacterium]MDY6382320.1 HigA family addiction module antitoxin [Cyanobacteriota bacterium]HCB11748.1 addiction module antidote protein, HigA family [Cyanobacteria bacterium UBA11991]
MEMYNPPHPGEILKGMYLPEYKLSVSAFALKLGVSRTTASELVNCKNGISAEMALKLAKAFGTSPQYWLNLQQAYDLWRARQRTNLDNVEIIAM